MEFWQMAWNMDVLTEDKLRKVVITEDNEFGEITKEEFKSITNKDFDIKPVEKNSLSDTIKEDTKDKDN